MPELRRGVRRCRAPVDKPRSPAKRSEHLVGNYVRTRAAAAKEAANAKAAEARRPRIRLTPKEEAPVIVISEESSDLDRNRIEEEIKEAEEEGVGLVIGKEKMDDDSGGLSANKVTGQEEEGSTTPFPETVSMPARMF